jgi:hypothetical protein
MKNSLKLGILNELLKIILNLPLCVFISTMASCEDDGKIECELKVTVEQDDGTPVEGAEIAVRYPVGIKVNSGGGFPTDRHETSKTASNSKGEAALNYQTVSSPEGLLWIKKKDFYPSIYQEHSWKKSGGRVNNYLAEIKAILNPIKNPIPMHAYSNIGGMEKIVKIPEIGENYGFDLMLAEALPPLGNGKTADFTFVIEGVYRGAGSNDMSLKITFPSIHDGVIEFKTPQRVGMREPQISGSQLLSEHLAPEAGYVPEIIRTTKRVSLTQPADKNDDIHRNFYFRTRTQVDADGQIVSANYGKIYGDFHFTGANSDWGYIATLALITTYFNPVPNERNVEFDPKRNLNPEGNVHEP